MTIQNETNTSDVERLIAKTLEKWADDQVNLGSESARQTLAKSIAQDVEPYINQLIEDIVCPPAIGY